MEVNIVESRNRENVDPHDRTKDKDGQSCMYTTIYTLLAFNDRKNASHDDTTIE